MRERLSTWWWQARTWLPSVPRWSWTLPAIGAVVVAVVAIGWNASREIESQTATLIARANALETEKDRLTTIKDLSQYQIDSQVKVWTLLAQVIGAAVLGIGGYVTWRNLQATLAKLEIDREGQITNRFIQAVGQLGAELKDGRPNLEVRLGGIYALERISHDSPRDHWTIMEILTAYVRQNAPWPRAGETPLEEGGAPTNSGNLPKPRTDIQAILTVIGRRRIPTDFSEPGPLDLSGTDLRGTDLRGAHLERMDLHRAHLDGASLDNAHLRKADLNEAGLREVSAERVHLEGAFLAGAHLEGALLHEAHLTRARLWGAHLDGALLFGAHLEQADLGGAGLTGANLQHANLVGAGLARARLRGARCFHANMERSYLAETDLVDANLERANLQHVNLYGAQMHGADLGGANLNSADARHSVGLTKEQVTKAFEGGKGAILPDGFWDDDCSAPIKDEASE